MRRFFPVLGAIAATFAGPQAAQVQAQDDFAVFVPKGRWTADYGEDYCRLIRTFSGGKDELTMALERTQPGDFVRLVFVGDGLSPFSGATEIGYRFLPAGARGKLRFVGGKSGDGKQILSFEPVTLAPLAIGGPGTVPPPYDRTKERAAATAITAIELSSGLAKPVRLDTGTLGAPIGVMQACTDDLLTVWGLDPEKHKTLSASAIPNPDRRGVLAPTMIPFSEFGKFAGGANQIRLAISAEGKPTACVVYAPTLAQSLNERICAAIMDKATFQPARDSEGHALASYWMGPPLAFLPPPPGRR